MTAAGWAQTLLSLSLVVIFLGFLIWGIRSGQFRDIEEPKYRMLDNEESGEEPDGEERT
jgi:cbb3-type cytochrome oxidase maturation protein